MTTDLLIDARALQGTSDGAGNYLREVLPRLLPQAAGATVAMVVHPSRASYWAELLPGVAQVLAADNPVGVSNQVYLPMRLAQLRPRVYFCPNNTPPLLVPGRLVFTVHDLTPLTHRPYFETGSTLKTAAFHAMVWAALRRATRVIAVSAYTKSCIASQFGEEFAAITDVIHHGCSRSVASRSSGKDSHFLYVGTDRPHKNLARLLDAYELACRRVPGLPELVVAGQARRPDLWRSRIATPDLAGRVRLVGYVEDADLETLYRDAAALVFPSLSEGFGLPILEAMRRGVPVLTGRESATVEVAGDAARLVDASSVSSIADGLVDLWSNPELRSTLRQRGDERCGRFDWTTAARQTWDVLSRQLEAP